MKGLPLTLLLLAGFTFGAIETGRTQEADEAMQRAMSILRASPLVDTHNDLPWVIREKASGDVKEFDISVRRDLDTDIPRLREGMVGTQFWSVWVPSSLSPLDAMRQQLEQIDLARRMIAAYADDFGFAVSTADIQREQRRGRIASLIGIEGGHSMGNSLGALRAYYDLGVRYMTLTHFHTIDWADSATDEARHDGITPFGEDVAGRKAELLRCHRSQQERNLQSRGYGLDQRILEVNRRAAKRLRLDEPYAEAFEIQRLGRGPAVDGSHPVRIECALLRGPKEVALKVTAVLLAIALLPGGASAQTPAQDPGTIGSEAIYTALRSVGFDGSRSLALENMLLERGPAVFHFDSGVWIPLQAVGERVTGAVFLGDGRFDFNPP